MRCPCRALLKASPARCSETTHPSAAQLGLAALVSSEMATKTAAVGGSALTADTRAFARLSSQLCILHPVYRTSWVMRPMVIAEIGGDSTHQQLSMRSVL